MAEHLQKHKLLENALLTIENGPSDAAGSIVEVALTEMLSPTTTDIGNVSLDALLSSGRTENMMNRALRARLAAWAVVIDEVWDDQHANAKMVYEIHVPYFVNEHIPAGAAMRHWYKDWPIPAAKTVLEEIDKSLINN